jgi:hypothetical protein
MARTIFRARKLFRGLSYFDGLRHSNREVFRLFNEAPRIHCVRFGRINEIKPKEIFLVADTHVKAVAVIRRIRDQPAIFQHNPSFGFAACSSVDSRDPENAGENKRELAKGKPAPHFNHGIWSRAKCAAYVATIPPKTLPAITSLTKW